MAKKKSDFYKEEMLYYIYALIGRDDEEETCFVGMSRAKRPKKRLYEHLHGKNRWTRDDFGPKSTGEKPKFVLLESLICTGVEAYKHVLSWVCYFEDEGFVLLGSPKMSRDTEYLFEDTKKIFYECCAPYELEDVLSRHVPLHKKETLDEVPEEPKPKMRNLNIRLSEEELQQFNAVCDADGLPQRETLNRLVMVANRRDFLERLREAEKKIALLEDETKRLNQERVLEEREITRRYKESLLCIKSMLNEYVLQNDAHQKGEKIISAKKARLERLHTDYNYPEGSGAGILEVDWLALGTGRRPPVFVFGRTEAGDKIKLRHYAKCEYVGQYPSRLRNVGHGAKMLVAYVPAKDGATDLVAGLIDGFVSRGPDSAPGKTFDKLPDRSLDKAPDKEVLPKVGERERQTRSLDSIISDIESRANKIGKHR